MVRFSDLLAHLLSVSILLAALAPVAAAQTSTLGHIDIVPDGPGALRVRGLHYASTSPGQQDVLFTFTATAPPSGMKYAYWYVDNVQITSATNTLACPYLAVGVGKHLVTVKVTPNTGKILEGSLTFAAIGGPLTYDVFNAEDGAKVPTHDATDVTKPFHLQYFDYTYSGTPSVPTGAQRPQCGSAAAAIPQLDPGTTYTWTLSGPGQAFITGLNGSSVFVATSGGSTSGAIKARLTFHYDDNQGLSGDAQDDSEETPPPGQSSPSAAYYSFTAHRPTRVEKISSQALTHQMGGVYPSTSPWTYQDAFFHRLYDNNGDGQPGVWVTERFPDASTVIANWNAATGQSLSLSNAATTGLNFDSTYGTGYGYGDLGNPDGIGLQDIVGNAAHPNPSFYPDLIFDQEYFAATHTTTLGAWGLLVQYWTNTCGATSVSHEKS